MEYFFLIRCWWNGENIQPLWEDIWESLTNVIFLIHESPMLFSGIYVILYLFIAFILLPEHKHSHKDSN